MNQEEYIEWNLIARKLKGKLSETEEETLRRWLEADEAHRRYFEKAADMWEEPWNAEEPDLEKLMERFDRFADQTPVRVHRTTRWYLWWKYAAVILLIAGIAGWLLQQRESVNPVVPVAKVSTQPIVPGGPRATILLADGRQIHLDSLGKEGLVRQEQGAAIRLSEGKVVYETTQPAEKEVYHTVVIPRGGEYCLKLADGTNVWLNSSTRLKFPVNFIGDRRLVELEGEAYFEVMKDATRPFIVRTLRSDIRVYGTSFNVRAYTDEEIQYTTLAEGKVGILRKGKEYFLKPRQQARLGQQAQEITIEEVDPDLYCSWHKGLFLFENERLENILKRLSDWYDIQVVFTAEQLKDLHFTGDLEKYADFTDILTLIGMTTHVDFKISGRIVTVCASSK